VIDMSFECKKGQPDRALQFKVFLKVWQCTIRDCFRIILSYLRIAFHTQDNTVFVPAITAFSGRYSLSGLPPIFNVLASVDKIEQVPTSGTHSIGVSFDAPALSLPSPLNRPPLELQNSSPPSYTWKAGCAGDDWWYCINDKWVGIRITEIRYLCMLGISPTPLKMIRLKHPSFRISFTPLNNQYSGKYGDIIEAPTLAKAKSLAEWYYEEWRKVNHNIDNSPKIDYPLAKRLGGIDDGEGKPFKDSKSIRGHNSDED
jgi:hypothetical protein